MPGSPEHEALRETAQIIPFPVRRDAGRMTGRAGARAGGIRLPTGVVMSDCGSGWYHDAAVQEESRKRPPR